MGYASKDGRLEPTFLFIDTYFVDTTWFQRLETTGQIPAASPCGIVGLAPDQNYTETNPKASVCLRMLDRPATELDTMTMGTQAYGLVGLELTLKAKSSSSYNSCPRDP